MAIQINPVDFRGFSLGGGSVPQLPNIGALGLQAIQAQMQSRDNAAQIAAQERMNMARIRSADEAMLRQNILDRDKLNIQQNQFNQNYRLDKRKMGLLESQNEAENSLKQQQLDNNMALDSQKINLAEVEQKYNAWKAMQENARENLKLEMIQLKDKKKDEIDAMGAFAVNGRMAMNSVKDPNDARVMQLEILNEAEKNGYISKDMAKQMRQMPVSGFKNALEFKILQLDKVKEYQAMNDIQNPKKSTSGVSLNVSPDGSVQYTSQPTGANTTKVQDSLSEAEESLKQVQDYLNPSEDMFGLRAGKQIINKIRKQGDVIPGVGLNEAESKQLADYTEYNANAKLMVMKTAKAMAGSRFSDTDLAMINEIMPQVGPGTTKTEYDAKAKLVLEYLNNLKKVNQGILKSGYNLGGADYFRQGLKAKGYSDEEINAFLKSKGM